MRLLMQLLGLAMLPLAFAGAARAESASGALYSVAYVDVASASVPNGTALLRQYRDAVRKQAGNERCEIGEEIGRPNRFVILEVWKDQAALDAHGKDATTVALRDKLKAIELGPVDERVHSAFAVGPNAAIGAKRAVFVVSHVDVPPPRKDDVIAILNPLADASRKSDGNLRFEVVQQTSRPNHFHVIEVWKDSPAYGARSTSAAQKQFREKLGPMLGALYDERLYRALD